MRPWTLLGLILALGLATPALAEAPFGSLGGIVGGGSGGNGILPLHGWCLDDDGILAVDIFVDGAIVGRANYGRRRPDVQRAFPGYPDSANAGFAFQLDTTRFLNGVYQVDPQCISKSGERTLGRGKRLEFTNTVENLVPFGLIDFPNRNAQVFGNCDAADPARRYSVVQGWALDVGLETGDAGVGYVELLIDGAIYANTRRDCDFVEEAGGLSNCYGLERPDVERSYPGVLDAPNSGFRFVLDIGALIDIAGFARGRHTLTARAGDIIGQVANISEIPVVFLCDDDISNEGSFGRVGQPINGSSHAGGMTVLGWALDWEGVREVEVSVDGVLVGTASYGGFRGGVTQIYPGYPDSLRPGFGFIVDTTLLSNGRHQLQVHVIDNAVPNVRTLIGERTFSVSN
jgi:N-acetylmuramoyl-L-alanine amidase